MIFCCSPDKFYKKEGEEPMGDSILINFANSGDTEASTVNVHCTSCTSTSYTAIYTMTEGWQLAILAASGSLCYNGGSASVISSTRVYYNDGSLAQPIGTIQYTSGSNTLSQSLVAWHNDAYPVSFRLSASASSGNNPWTNSYTAQYVQGRLFWI